VVDPVAGDQNKMSINLGSELPDQGRNRILSGSHSTPLNMIGHAPGLQQLLPYRQTLHTINNNYDSRSAGFCCSQDASKQNRYGADFGQRKAEARIVGNDNGQVRGAAYFTVSSPSGGV
jgi:hypothetical protein